MLKAKKRGWLIKIGAISAILTAGGITAFGLWLAVILILDPNGVVWLNRFLPEWTEISVTLRNPPQSLTDIEAEIQALGLKMGEYQVLESNILIPLTQYRSDCNCEDIVALRVYQTAQIPGDDQQYYSLVQEAKVPKIEEYFAIAPLYKKELGNTQGRGNLPVTSLNFFPKTSAPGIWINVHGKQKRSDATIVYGQVFHYNPETLHLSYEIPWTSPAESIPQWQEITGGGTPELVVNQSIGFEPQFQVYTLAPREFAPNPIYLEEISLRNPPPQLTTALDSYRQALNLSQRGLWSPALEKLQGLKQQLGEDSWVDSAQAQMDTIALHAKFTQSQCQKTWASPAQQILACLMNGEWTTALEVFKASESIIIAQDIQKLLETDRGRIRKRVEIALEDDSTAINLLTWGALLEASQKGREKAVAWLEAKKVSPETRLEVEAILDQWEFAIAENTRQKLYVSRIIGTAKPLSNTEVNSADWLQPESNDSLPSLQPQQSWYSVQVNAYHDGQKWQEAPFNLRLSSYAPGKQLWLKLGLNLDPWMSISTWTGTQQQTLLTKVQAAQIKDGTLNLLVSGQTLNNTPSNRLSPLAYSNAAFRWIEPGAVSFNNLNQLQPEWVSAMLPVLWQELQTAQKKPTTPIPKLPQLLEEMGHWLVRPTDLTGNGQPDAILRLYPDSTGKLQPPTLIEDSLISNSRTLIFSHTGNLIYSEISRNSSEALAGIVNLGDDKTPVLLINNQNNYRIQRWSTEQKRFE